VASYYLKTDQANIYQKGVRDGEQERAALKEKVQAKDTRLAEIGKERELERHAADQAIQTLRVEVEALKAGGATANPRIEELKAAFEEKTAELLKAERESGESQRAQASQRIADLEIKLVSLTAERDQAREEAEAARSESSQLADRDAETQTRIEQAVAAARLEAEEELAKARQAQAQEAAEREAADSALAAVNTEWTRMEQAVAEAQGQAAEADARAEEEKAAREKAEDALRAARAEAEETGGERERRIAEKIAELEEQLAEAAMGHEQAAGELISLREENAELRRLFEEAEVRSGDGIAEANRRMNDAAERAEQDLDAVRGAAAEALAAARQEAEARIAAALAERDRAQEELLQFQIAQEEAAKAQAAREAEAAADPSAMELAAMRQTLTRLETSFAEIARERGGTLENLAGEIAGLARSVRSTSPLSVWKGVNLRRAVDLAGLNEYCRPNEDGTVVRVALADGQTVVLDGRLSPEPYWEANEATGAARDERLAAFAVAARAHVERLAAAASDGDEMHVAFLPSDLMYAAAVERDGSLVEYGAERGVLLATPATLVALLRAVRFGWRRDEAARQAREVAALARTLCDGVVHYAAQTAELKASLESTVQILQRSTAALDSHVLGSARQLQTALGAAIGAVPNTAPRPVYHGSNGIDALNQAIDPQPAGVHVG
jgi:DNA recombination protein RmuC